MAPTEDHKAKVEQACQAAEEFSKLYYEHFDKKRHLIRKLYLDTSTVVWNGSVCNGGEAINAHFDALPASEHVISSLDTQPLVEPLNPNEMAIAVSVFGTVKYQNNKNKAFTQNFTLSSQGTVWKIVSDVFRFLEKP
ncbi:NTF2-related export protein 2-like isoform X2 [Haliotis rubra]|uniref:NTF2-related export protein 2-like isoform X2 n=1 Tax=Haliotis rubra TaxID=36100 RepID=UPI001EE5A342|nr:NTF2-related export protein 2-like isoform X2 [Haliotis rubra]